MTRPVATVRAQTVGKSVFDSATGKRVPGYSDEIATVREAWCGKSWGQEDGGQPHRTATFEGVNAKGWIFWCRDCEARFIADPPRGTK
jgi:hypothetical protein